MLPTRQRMALYVKEVEEQRYSDIALVLNCSESAVETLLFRARRNFAERFGSVAEDRAVYEPGVKPKDIEPVAFPFVNDAERRVFLGRGCHPMPTTSSTSRKYLVICKNIAPQFEEAQMRGWMAVQ